MYTLYALEVAHIIFLTFHINLHNHSQYDNFEFPSCIHIVNIFKIFFPNMYPYARLGLILDLKEGEKTLILLGGGCELRVCLSKPPHQSPDSTRHCERV